MTESRQTSRARRWIVALTTLALLAMTVLIPVASVRAAEQPNPVLDWNINTVNAIGNAPTAAIPGLGQPPPIAVIHLGMVHGAIYDAVNAIDGGHQPYLGGLSAPRALRWPLPSRRRPAMSCSRHLPLGTPPQVQVDECCTAYIDLIPNSHAKTKGIETGQAAAADERSEGRRRPLCWRAVVTARVRRMAPGGTALNNVFAWVANVKPFTLKGTDQFRTEGMTPDEPAVGGGVQRGQGAGIEVPSTRTDEQTLLASFFSFNLFSFNKTGPRHRGGQRAHDARAGPALCQDDHRGSRRADQLLGQQGTLAAWRPQTAIRVAANDGNPLTVAGPHLDRRYSQNPGYPDDPSGYNCFTGGFLQQRQVLLRDRQVRLLAESGVPGIAAAGNPVGVPGRPAPTRGSPA